MELRTEFCGVEFENPLVLAAGVLGSKKSIMKRLAKETPIGGITTKSIGPKRKGHNNPIIVEYEEGLLNAVGLSCPGVEPMLKDLEELKEEIDTPIIASVFAYSPEQFGKIIQKTTTKEPDIIEVNISCPNTEGEAFCKDEHLIRKVVKQAKENNKGIPITTKLSASVDSIIEEARAAVEAGTDGLTAINTIGPGMVIDVKTREPVLDFKKGGVSGPAIRPIATRCVWDLYKEFDVPIIGTGGVESGRDLIEKVMAGSTLVGAATASLKGLDIFERILKETRDFMKKEGYRSLKEIKGIAAE